jgi:hypothetical protein
MRIDGAYKATITVDGRQVGADAELFRDGKTLRSLYARTPVPIPAGLKREADVEVMVTFEPPVVPAVRAAWFVTTKHEEGPDDWEETGDFGPFASQDEADDWIDRVKGTLTDSVFFVREARPPESVELLGVELDDELLADAESEDGDEAEPAATATDEGDPPDEPVVHDPAEQVRDA